jgi:DNA-binding transcriptional ArsR family regulator
MLATLFDRPGPVSLEDLVAAVAAASGPGTDPPDRTDVAVTLRHSHLPKLREAGFVTVDDEGDQPSVALTSALERGPLSAAAVRSFTRSEGLALAALREHPVRRAILTQLEAGGPRLSLARLTRRLAAASSVTSTDGSTADPTDWAVSLDQVHLPKLAEVGLIDRGDAGRISYDAAEWVGLTDLLAALRAADVDPDGDVGLDGGHRDGEPGNGPRDYTSAR